MVICRGTVCIFIWVLLVDKYMCFLFFGIVKKCAVGEYPKSWMGRIQAA